MKLSVFDYDLPSELIAQTPAVQRDASRMMLIRRDTGLIEHHSFCDIDSYFHKGDVLVANDSLVIPARLTGTKETGGGIEILLLKRRDDGKDASAAIWDVLLKPAKRLRQGAVIHFGNAGEARVVERISDKKWRLAFSTAGTFDSFLNANGTAPLPPYIKRKRGEPDHVDDLKSYQTVYARVPGSVAAPTAGFHFSAQILERLAEKGVAVAFITLHVGYGTFVPRDVEEVEDHRMEEESFEITAEAARVINSARRVVAVGTTATRVLEAVADSSGVVSPMSGTTDLYIYPGYRFKRVNGLLTNFHLPKSSLFLLASSFAGISLLHRAYREAIGNRYRFYSYGDCTLIL
ncbi:MAG: tRNA preQ1(34) S-adenosylmethionine ribosyltransferase-isomerase QueA [Syntrophales bacterium]|nr:tRNA preQ1(34) S-adenosylmethionine ribosyltransferase-isomerase QueA [Syntrophales bacterium]